jgi:hypothetical protein
MDGNGHTLGDAPIEMSMHDAMNNIAVALDRILNGERIDKSGERMNGFVLLVFPFGDKTGRCNYISNGADRDDIVRMFKEQIRQFEAGKVAEASETSGPLVEGVAKINGVCHAFAAGQISRDECRRQLVHECNVADWGIDDMLDAYDPAKQ